MKGKKRIRRTVLLAVLSFITVLLISYYFAVTRYAVSATNTGFLHRVIDPNPPSGSDCCLDILSIGDIDGDGAADVMVGSERSVGAVWYHYPTWEKYSIGEGGFTTDGEIADLDQDGDGDVVISSISRDQIEWWENTGDPFKPSGWVRHKIGDRFSHDVVVGDVNGDKNLDVVIFRKDDPQQITWFAAPNDPRQTWTRHEVDTPSGEGLDLGDIDNDGDLDIAGGLNWYENVDRQGLSWSKHAITTDWGVYSRDIIADMNKDGKKDIVLSHAEGDGRVSWFENPTWKEHVIESEMLRGTHSLEVGDFNLDNKPDVLVGEMNTGGGKLLRNVLSHRVMVYENLGDANSWKRNILSTSGTHNARIGDLGANGSLDIVGKNYTGNKVVEMWENTTTTQSHLSLDRWTYFQVDNQRDVYRHSNKYFGLWRLLNRGTVQYFGLAMADLTGDRYADIVSGRYFYRNPGGNMSGRWSRTTFPVNLDAMLIVDVDNDPLPDVIGEALPDIYWLEAADAQGNNWTVTKVATMPAAGHGNGQGYRLAQIVPGGKPEILLSGGNGDREIYYFEIPENPGAGNWKSTRITNEATDEGIAVGDIDRDGDIDIAAGDMYTKGDRIAWWKNPGNGLGNWTKYKLGTVENWPDRFASADINGDGRLDIVVSEENEGQQPNASVYWFEQPENLNQPRWERHLVTTQYTTNSLDVADMDQDGAIDIITGEHRGTKAVKIWRNVNKGMSWEDHTVSVGKESHLGSRVADLDGDGDLEIISIAWDKYQDLHLWRNDAK